MRSTSGLPGNSWRALFSQENPETWPSRTLLMMVVGTVLFAGLILVVFLLTR